MSVIMSRKVIVGVVLVVLILAAGIGGYYYYYLPSTKPLVPNPDTLVIQGIGDPTDLDPARNYETAGSGVLELVMDSLVWYDRDTSNVKPQLLDPGFGGGKGFTVSPDGLVYTFKLRAGVKFQDGTPLDARAVKYNFDRTILINDPDGPAWMIAEAAPIKGGPRYFNADTWGVTNKTEVDAYLAAGGVKVIDDLTLQITLEAPYAAFPQILGYVPKIASPTHIEKNGGMKPGFPNPAIDKFPVGSGSFKFVEWIPKQRIVIERDDAYWGTKANVKRIVIQVVQEFGTRLLAFFAGDADMITVPEPNAFDLIQKDAWLKEKRVVPVKKGYFFDTFPRLILSGFGLNTAIPPFNNKDFRSGLAYSFDYDEYIRSVVSGFATQPFGFIPEGLFGHDKTLPQYKKNVELAKAGFARAKAAGVYKDGQEITVFYNAGNEARRLGSLLLKDSVEKLGVGVTLKVQELDWPTFLAKSRKRELPVFFLGWLADYADPDNFIATYAHSKLGVFAKRVGYKNPETDKLVEQAARELDPQKRSDLYKKIQQTLLDEFIFLNLTQGLSINVRRDWIKGWFPNPIRSLGTNYDVSKDERTDQVSIDIGAVTIPNYAAALPVFLSRDEDYPYLS